MASALGDGIPSIDIGCTDDIQELRRCNPAFVPERYIREIDETKDSISGICSVEIPIIDLSKLVGGNEEEFQREIDNLTNACEHWGFFQVINHGVDLKLLEDMQRLIKEFFMLPLEEKEKYPMIPGTVQGYGHAFIFSEDQKLDWCNMFALAVEPPSIRLPKLWPEKPEKFGETLQLYSINIRKLCQNLLRFIAKTLGLEEEVFNDMFKVAVQAVRMNYYPPCSRPDLVLGLSSHSDGSALTVLQQDTGCVGLQILKDGFWVPVVPIVNALVINIGDTIEVLTNGKYKSVEHRAVTNKEKDRLSVVTFYAPSYSISLGPMPEFITDDRPCMYKSYNHGDYSRYYVTHKLEGKKTLESVKLNTSM